MKTKKARLLQASILLVLFIVLLFTDIYVNRTVKYFAADSFFLENNRGSYAFVEVNLPEGEGPFPIVFLAHGFAGSIHSGGAMELSNRLADAGIIAIRCDWNPYVEKSKKSERVNTYALRDMIDDYKMVMEYAIKNYDVDIDRIGVYGRSYGGRFAMLCANDSIGGYDNKALCLVAPAGDDVCFKRFLGGDDKYDWLKNKALKNNKASHLGVNLTADWFEDVEKTNPSKEGYKFEGKPVLLIYNTLDDIVYPDTSMRCANAYSNCETIEITSTDGHGHEMGFKKSHIKNMIMKRIVKFFVDNL